jgi:hypothetical protein
MNINLELTSSEHKDLLSYCKLNNVDPETILKSSYLEGFRIEKYGLLSGSNSIVEKEVIKEVIKYVEVPVIEEKEVIKIEYVEILDESRINELLLKIQQLENQPPKIIETIKEVVVEKEVLGKEIEVFKEVIVEKEVFKEVIVEKEVIKEIIIESDDSKLKPKLDALQNTVQKLKLDNIEKDKLIKEYEKTIQNIQQFNEGTKAMYMKGSNLDNKL